MAVVGAFGSLVFQVSERTIQTIDSAEWSGSARYAVHQRHNQNALTEFAGLDPDKFKFSMTLLRELGASVMYSLTLLWDYQRKGEAHHLVLGDKCYGKSRWAVASHNIALKQYDRRGNLTAAEVTVELLEYLRK